jgi:alpha-beta hydrolase superfamily lysophospholipase
MSLGQEADIATLKKAYLKTRKDYPNAEIVLIGLSRGASTIINFLAEHQPTHIKAVILESPFDTVAGVIDHFCKQANMASKPLLDMSQKILSWVSSYKPSGIQPIHTIHKIPSTIPVLFICSKEDRVVPASGTITLYETLRLSGHSKAHILILDQGKHGFLLTGPQAKIYQSTVHAFYKHYRLDHDPIMANFGMKYLHTFL